MLPYYILIFFPIVPLFFRIIGRESYNPKTASIGAFFAIFLMMLVLRHETIGRDLGAYKILYNAYKALDWRSVFSLGSEPGYIILNKLVASTVDDFRWVIILAAVLTVVPMWITYRKTIEDPVLSIVIFIILPTFVMPFSGLRQSVAISLGFVAYELVKKRKLIFFILVSLLAMSFHFSAFMLFFMYPLYHAKITKKWLIAVIPAILAVWVFNKPIFKFMQIFIRDWYEADIAENGAYSMLILFILFGVFSFVIPDEEQMDEETLGLRNLMLMAIVLQMFVPLHNLAMRMNYYYIVFIPLLIPKIIKIRSVRWNQVAVISRYVLLIYLLIYFFDHMPSGNILDTFPYKFYWETSL